MLFRSRRRRQRINLGFVQDVRTNVFVIAHVVPAEILELLGILRQGLRGLAAHSGQRGELRPHGRPGAALAGEKRRSERSESLGFAHLASLPYWATRRPKPPCGRCVPGSCEMEPGAAKIVRRKFFSSRSAT